MDRLLSPSPHASSPHASSPRGEPRLGLAALVALSVLSCASPPRMPPAADLPRRGDPRLAEALVAVAAARGLPGIAACVVDKEGLIAIAAAGFRKAGSPEAVELEDLWPIGSDSKAMLALLAADLVEEGSLSWKDSPQKVVPDLGRSAHPGYADLDLRLLLDHRGGLPRDPGFGYFTEDFLFPRSPERAKRYRASAAALRAAPVYPVGARRSYSNLGYIVASLMLEEAGGSDWRELLRARIFGPLGMASAGFGGVGAPGAVDQPWGHDPKGRPDRMNGPDSDFLPSVGLVLSGHGPAGRVHLSMEDWARFVREIMRGEEGEGVVLSREGYRSLLEPAADGLSSPGWGRRNSAWAGGEVLAHDGSTGHYYARVELSLERDLAVLVCANRGSAAAAMDEAVAAVMAATALGPAR